MWTAESVSIVTCGLAANVEDIDARAPNVCMPSAAPVAAGPLAAAADVAAADADAVAAADLEIPCEHFARIDEIVPAPWKQDDPIR